MASITRDQFLRSKHVQMKVHQKGSLLMDADLNEQNDVDLERYRRVLSCLLLREDVRFDYGFWITANSTALTVNIMAGDAAFHLDDDHAALVTHEGTTELTGFQSWVAGGVQRTDVVYIDIEEKEISPEDDPNIVNPAAGAETCRDIRLEYTVRIASDTSSVPTAPAGHVYRPLVTITKDGSSDQIVSNDIELLLRELGTVAALETMEIPFWMEAAVSHSSYDAQDLDNVDFRFVVSEPDGGSKTNIVIKVPYVYDPAHKYLALHCQTRKNDYEIEAWVRLDGFSQTGTTEIISSFNKDEPPNHIISYLEIPPGLTAGQVYDIQVVLYGSATTANYVTMYRPVICAGVGQLPITGGV